MAAGKLAPRERYDRRFERTGPLRFGLNLCSICKEQKRNREHDEVRIVGPACRIE